MLNQPLGSTRKHLLGAVFLIDPERQAPGEMQTIHSRHDNDLAGEGCGIVNGESAWLLTELTSWHLRVLFRRTDRGSESFRVGL